MHRVLLVLAALFVAATVNAQVSSVDAARGVLTRLMGRRADEVDFQEIHKSGKLDVFEVEVSDGRIHVRGSSGVAMCRGAYEYLKEHCDVLVAWEGSHVDLPKKFPDAPRRRVVCPQEFRHYFNVCTFGYSATFWDWKRWQREIDWMALHGINMPLAMTGQEAVWKRVWRSYGLTDAEIDSFFSGPAFLPWHRMGNINTHAGPLPESWHTSQTKLQKQILSAERALGMKPVTPAFSGFLPPAFLKKHPNTQFIPSTAWAGFEPTYLLSASEPLFEEIGKKFIQEYRKEFGTDHLYLADLFNEMTPRVPEETKLASLHAMGQAVMRSIQSGDPDGIWVTQGWFLLNEKDYWKEPEADAFFSGVPDDKCIVIDLGGEEYEVWRHQPAVRKKRWIWCTLHDFGGNTRLFGDPAGYAREAMRAFHDPAKGGMVGMGLTMEGIEQNALIYEYMSDLMWRNDEPDRATWLQEYTRDRYGVDSDVWKRLYELVYRERNAWYHAPYQFRPDLSAGGEAATQTIDFIHLLRDMTAPTVDARLRKNPQYLHDVVEVGKRTIEEVQKPMLDEVADAYDSKDLAAFDLASAKFLQSCDEVDALLATRPEFRMESWLDQARSLGKNETEKAFYEWNARTQVTIWGGPVLFDYAAKEWSGLTRDFYKERWKMLFADVRKGLTGGKYDGEATRNRITAWEEAWTHGHGLSPSKPNADPLALGAKIAANYDGFAVRAVDRGIAVGKPVTSSGHTEGEAVPSIVTDGSSTGAFWAAGPGPQWVQIDLQQPETLGAITVFPYVDGSRYYQYTIETSLDGEHWQTTVDWSKNTKISGRRGERHSFAPTQARYIKVNMLLNSANPSMHLHEVRVFRAATP